MILPLFNHGPSCSSIFIPISPWTSMRGVAFPTVQYIPVAHYHSKKILRLNYFNISSLSPVVKSSTPEIILDSQHVHLSQRNSTEKQVQPTSTILLRRHSRRCSKSPVCYLNVAGALCGCSCAEPGVGPDDPCGTLPTGEILRFYELSPNVICKHTEQIENN